MVRPDNTTAHMPGKIAERYEELGGSCVSFGKPHAPHFEACVRALGLPKDKVVHVGDSLHHDVKGANASGLASVFVVGGIHREELASELGALPTKEKLDEIIAKHNQIPTHVIPMFRM
jgi:ribonucleotide monophosphatase NagD (HAD superfamily)